MKIFVLIHKHKTKPNVIFITNKDEVRIIKGNESSVYKGKDDARVNWDELIEQGYQLEEAEWQDEERTWTEIDKVYTGRIDCEVVREEDSPTIFSELDLDEMFKLMVTE